MLLPVNIITELVVRRKGNDRAKAHIQGEKTLAHRGKPYLKN